jgi:quercetin dioxygenase-like cupin family protein
VDTAKDLTVEEPRGLDAELEGYAWLPRMLDKARASLAGTAGRYQFGCPVDHTCMARLGVAPELVLDLAARHADDHAVLSALRAHGIPPAAQAWFDGQAVEDELQQTGNYLRVRDHDQLPEAGGGRVFSGAEHGAGVSVVVIDAAPGKEQEPHAHTVEEVIAVQQGAAWFFLGEQQARIVRAGEIVRIPAGVLHRWIAAPSGLRAVAAYGAPEIVTETDAKPPASPTTSSSTSELQDRA